MLISPRHCHAIALCVLLGLLLSCQGSTTAPTEAELEFQRGRNALAEQQYEWARKHFGRVVELDPNHQEALRLAAIAWLNGPSQSLGPAVDYCRTYLELQPDNAEVQQRLANSLMLLGEASQALEILDTMDPTPDLQLLEARLHLADDPEASLQHSLPQIDHPTFGYRALDLASQAHALAGRTDDAIEAAESSLRLHPLQDKVLYRLSRLYVQRRLMEEAQDAIRRSQQATALLNAAASLSPTERLRRWQGAAQDLNPNNLHVAQSQAELFIALTDLPSAQRAMNVLEAQESAAGTKRDVDLWLDWAALLARNGQVEAGEAVMETLLASHGEDRRVRYRWAMWLISAERLDAAREAIAESRRLEPHLARFRVAEAELALREERRPEAVEALQDALHWAPWKADWRRQLMQLHLDVGDRETARRVLDEAPETHPLLEAMQRQHWPEG